MRARDSHGATVVLFALALIVVCKGVGRWEFEPAAPYPSMLYRMGLYKDKIYVLNDNAGIQASSTNPYITEIGVCEKSTLSCHVQRTTGEAPFIRTLFSISVDESRGILYFFGGTTSGGFFNDLYLMSLDTFVWETIDAAGLLPSGRFNSYSFVDDHAFYILGGHNPSGTNDVWKYTPDTNTWSLIVDPGSSVKAQFIVDGVFQDGKYYIFGGCGVLESVCPAQLIIYDNNRSKWEDTVEYNFLSQNYGSIKVYNNTIFALGGYVDGKVDFKTFAITRIDLKSKLLIGRDFYTLEQSSIFPIKVPSGRIFLTSLLIGDKFYFLGGLSMSINNHFWVYSPDRNEWKGNNIGHYPLSRINPHVTEVSENEFGLFGGLHLDAFIVPINDLWTYNTETKVWKRLSQESMCPTTQYDCAPNVFGSAFGYFRGSFFVIGGFTLSPDVSPVARKYIAAIGIWVPVLFTHQYAYFVSLRYKVGFKTIGTHLFIWGGQDPMGNIATPEVIIFDLESEQMSFEFPTSYSLQGATDVMGLNIDDKFCVTGNLSSIVGIGNSIWCFNPSTLHWNHMANIPAKIIMNQSFLDYYINLIVFGGNDAKSGPANQFAMYDVHKNVIGDLGGYVKPLKVYGGSSIVLSGVIYIIAGFIDLFYTSTSNSLYSFKLAETWCSGKQTVTASDQRIEDGSKQFKYFPGTDCSWEIFNATYIVVDAVDVGLGASLVLENMDNCSQPITANGKQSNWLSISNTSKGSVIYIPSQRVRLHFVVDMDVLTHDGFSISLYDCNLGFSLGENGCVCSAGRYVNSLGDCIKCPPGTNQPLENQHTCERDNLPEIPKNIPSIDARPGEIVESSEYLPPLLQSSMAVVEDAIYVAGGYSVVDSEGNKEYSSMETLYKSTELYKSKWSRLAVSGEMPSPRADFCFVGVKEIAVLIGGKTQTLDPYIYHLDVKRSIWRKTTSNPNMRIGSVCVGYKDGIYIYGGLKNDGTVSNEMQLYYPGNETVRLVHTIGIAPRIGHAGGGLWQSSFFIFGGWNGAGEQGVLYALDLETMRWLKNKTVELDPCTECDQDKGICDFSRQRMVSGVAGNRMHIYGGSLNGQILADVLIIELGSGIVTKRENYGIFAPKFPLKTPPPKSGGVGGIYGNQLVVMGGMGITGDMGNDIWTWDTDLQTWSDSSIFRTPIHRTEAGIVKETDGSFIIFGGSTIYIGETLLNDLWRFNTLTKTWEVIERESNGLKPYGRAGAMMGLYANKVFVLGGRTSVRVDDHFLWSFDLEKRTWGCTDATVSLRANERPFNRVGAQSVQIGKHLWIWGGQLALGLENVERYTSIYLVDLELNTIESKTSRTLDPRIRQYHGFVQADNSTISMVGGETFSGNALSDIWELDIDEVKWKPCGFKSYGMKLSKLIAANMNGNIVGFGSNSPSTNAAWMIQRDYGVASNLFVGSQLPGFKMISEQSGTTFDDVIVMFGGRRGSTMTNQVVTYKPGFCDPRIATVYESTPNPHVFDDGSGDGMYLSTTDCSWILPTATQLNVNYTIRQGDSIVVYQGTEEDGKNQILAGSYEGNSVNYRLSSANGFMIRFRTVGYDSLNSKSIASQPCEDCKGFQVTHAVCSSHSTLNVLSGSCVCDKGYSMNNGICEHESKSSPDITIGAIIGGVLGFSMIVVCIAGYRYKKKITEINLKEKLLYAHVEYSDLEMGQLIGSGSFGEVYAGKWRGADVAVKRLNFKKITKEAMKEFEHEIQIMVELRHPNLVLYMGACVQQPNLCILSELMTRGSLYDALHNVDLDIDQNMKLHFLVDTAKGLQFLHSSNPPILHRDLKSPNILQNIFSDFGLSGVKDTRGKDGAPPGTLLWMAPEVINNAEYKPSADVYSYSIIMWEVLTRCEPYPGEMAFVVAYRVSQESYRPTIPNSDDIPQELQDLMTKCWDQDEIKRPTFSEILKQFSIRNSESNHGSLSTSLSFGKSMYAHSRTEAPNGRVVFVLLDIEGYRDIWESCPEEMSVALSTHNDIIRATLQRNKGYESKANGGSFMVAFSNIKNAITFSLQVQEMLVLSDWPDLVLKSKYAAVVSNSDIIIFRGLRTRMAIHMGEPQLRNDAISNRVVYFGDVVIHTSTMRDLAKGGQIIISEAIYEDIRGEVEYLSGLAIRDLSDHVLQVSTTSAKLFEILPKNLSGRTKYFAQEDKAIGSNIIMSIPSIDALRNWQLDIDDITVTDNVLGSGSFGTVYEGQFRGRRVAVKKFLNQKLQEKRYFNVLTEIMVLREIKHPSVISLFGACVKPPNICIVMEYAEHKSLSDVLLDAKISINVKDQKSIISQVSEAMKYLHERSPPIIHRDLKCANIMVFELQPFKVKVGDFGLARAKSDNQTMTKCGTRQWIAPEVLKGLRYNEKADVFSFGILVWEVLSREKPHPNEDPLQINMGIVNGLRPQPNKMFDEKLASLMQKCLDEDPKKRPSFAEIVNQLD